MAWFLVSSMGMQDIQDSDSGQIGLALSVSYGGMGDASTIQPIA